MHVIAYAGTGAPAIQAVLTNAVWLAHATIQRSVGRHYVASASGLPAKVRSSQKECACSGFGLAWFPCRCQLSAVHL